MKITTLYEYWTKILNKPLPKWQDRKPIYDFFKLNELQPLNLYSNYTGSLKQNIAFLNFLIDEKNKDQVNKYFNPQIQSETDNNTKKSGSYILPIIIGLLVLGFLVKKKK